MKTPPNTLALPAGYRLQTAMDLKKDRKINASIQVCFVMVMALMFILARRLQLPLQSGWGTGTLIPVTVLMAFAYIALHELTHGVAMKLLSGAKPVYFPRFPFVCTGSAAYFNRGSFILIALAPVILWGAILIALLLLLPPDFSLSVYIVIGLNFAGAAGDYFQTWAILKLPKSALIQDTGKVTGVFLPGK